MPIYEFYCEACHTIFNFLSRKVNTSKRPACPRCNRRLERRASAFAIGSDRIEAQATPAQPDDQAMERALSSFAESGELDDGDPRAMAGMMRKLYDGMGVRLGPGMDEAVRRMEAGEDPERIEQDLGDLLEDEQPLVADRSLKLSELKARSRRARAPSVDTTLYEL